MAKRYYVYILRCCDGSYYVGTTGDLQERLKAHNNGKGAKHTLHRRPVELVYSERHKTKLLAIQRERQIKRWTRAKKKALVTGQADKLKKLSKTP